MLKKYMLLFCVLLCGCLFLNMPRVSAETAGQNEVTLYDLNSSDREKITLPAELPQSYQLPQTGENVSYQVVSGWNDIRVSDEGLVTICRTYWKRMQGYSQTVSEGEDYDYYTVPSGDAQVEVTSDGGTMTWIFHLKDYADVYVDEVMDQYIAAHISEDMSDDALAEAIAKFPARYDYDEHHSSAVSMVIYGGGDCWASTDAIIRLAKKLGFDAWTRRGSLDAGASGSHVNAMMELHGKYYLLEAGYDSEKDESGYRPYNAGRRTSLFSYYITYDDKAMIYQYDGKTSEGEVEIPSELGGYTVTGLRSSALAGTDFTKIILPDSLEKIGDYAFRECKNLQEIKLPASVNSIGNGAFSSCDALERFSIDTDNKTYMQQDQLICTTDGKTLVAAVGKGSEVVAVPSTVEQIQSYAFYNCKNLKRITIPASVKELGESCFDGCTHLSSVDLQAGLKTIGNGCFRWNYDLSVLRIPATVTQVGEAAFYGDRSLRKIYFYGDAPVFGGQTGTGDQVFYGCAQGMQAYYPEGNTTWDDSACTDHGGDGVVWKTWTAGNILSIEDAEVTLSPEEYEYTGGEVRPEQIAVSLAGKTLTEGEDYVVTYPLGGEYTFGTASFFITGVGSYEGVKTVTYTIGKAEREETYFEISTSVTEGKTLQGFFVSSSQAVYASEDPSIVTIDQEGNITGVSAGTATITITIPETEYYKKWYREVQVTVEASERDPSGLPTPYPDSTANADENPGTSAAPKPSGTLSPEDEDLYWQFVYGTSKPRTTVSPSPLVSAKPDSDGDAEDGSTGIGKSFVYKNARYRITAKNKAAFTGLVKKSKANTVTIPAKAVYSGRSYKVTEIAAKACAGDKRLTKLILGKNISKIGKQAFWKCSKLKMIVYRGVKPKKKNIGKQAFSGTPMK